MIVATALTCMALTVYHEARGEQVPGQYAVAQVLFTRADQDPYRVCEEAFKSKQFSWTNKGVRRVTRGWLLDDRLKPKDDFAWWKAKRIAAMALSMRAGDFSRGATHYHVAGLKPIWRVNMTITRRLGSHVFYREA